MGLSTFSGPVRSKNGFETDAEGKVKIEGAQSSDVNQQLSITSEQAVEAIGTFTPSHKIKIRINGVEYWMQLDAV